VVIDFLLAVYCRVNVRIFPAGVYDIVVMPDLASRDAGPLLLTYDCFNGPLSAGIVGSWLVCLVMGTVDSDLAPEAQGKVRSDGQTQISGLCCNHLAEKPATPISITAEPAHLATAAGGTNYKCTNRTRNRPHRFHFPWSANMHLASPKSKNTTKNKTFMDMAHTRNYLIQPA